MRKILCIRIQDLCGWLKHLYKINVNYIDAIIIIYGDVGTAAGKVKALRAVGVKMADRISDIPKLLR